MTTHPKKQALAKCKYCPTLVDIETGPRIDIELVCHACFADYNRYAKPSRRAKKSRS